MNRARWANYNPSVASFVIRYIIYVPKIMKVGWQYIGLVKVVATINRFTFF